MEEHITAESVSAEFEQLGAEVGPDPEVLAAEQVQQDVAAGQDQGVAEYKALLAQLLAPSFGILAPNWQVGEKEIDALSESYACVLYKYFPNSLETFGAELGACLVTAAVVLPRLSVPRVAEEKPQNEGPTNEGS